MKQSGKWKENNMDENRIKACKILQNEKISDDLKLYEIFQIYKEDLKENYSQLYYALLAWKDSHLMELFNARTTENKPL